MINTIFWFADTKANYEFERDNQGISDKTIVFIKETGEIYVNNKNYGKSIQDLLNDPEIASVFNNNSVLKQQVQSMIDVLENKHDADITSLTGTINSNRAAQISDKDELNRKINNAKSEWNDRLNDAINELNGKIEESEQDSQNATQDIIDSIQDSISDMNTAISSATTTAQQASQRADQIYNSLDSTVSSAVQAAIQDANLSGDLGEVNTKINTLENGLSAVTTRVDGVVDNNGNIKYDVYQTIINNIIEDDSALTEIGSKVSANNQLTEEEVEVVEWWASQVQTYAENGSTFAQMVAAVDGGGSGSGEGVSEAYVIAKIQESLDGYVALTELNAKIQECQAFVDVQSTANTASANLLTTQGSLSNLETAVDNITKNGGFVDTKLAGVTSRVSDVEAKTSFIANYSANSGSTFNLSASEAESLMNSIVQHENAVATIKAVTTTDESGVDINTIVDGKIATAMTGYATQSWVDNDSNVAQSITNIVNAIKDSDDNLISSANILTKANNNESSISSLSTTVSGHTTSISGLQTSTSNNASAISSLGSRVSTVENGIQTINQSGFISSANLDGSVAALFAQNTTSDSKTNVTAYIGAQVQDGISNITLSADKITFNGSSNFTSAVQAVDLNADKITSGTLSADRIAVGDISIAANKVTGIDQLVADKIATADITANALSIKNSRDEVTAALNSDGSGQVAKNGISWTTDGTLTASKVFQNVTTPTQSTGYTASIPTGRYRYEIYDENNNLIDSTTYEESAGTGIYAFKTIPQNGKRIVYAECMRFENGLFVGTVEVQNSVIQYGQTDIINRTYPIEDIRLLAYTGVSANKLNTSFYTFESDLPTPTSNGCYTFVINPNTAYHTEIYNEYGILDSSVSTSELLNGDYAALFVYNGSWSNTGKWYKINSTDQTINIYPYAYKWDYFADTYGSELSSVGADPQAFDGSIFEGYVENSLDSNGNGWSNFGWLSGISGHDGDWTVVVFPNDGSSIPSEISSLSVDERICKGKVYVYNNNNWNATSLWITWGTLVNN